jgi:hypothetical protein
MRCLVWITIVLTVLFHSGTIVEIFLICRPLAYFWDLGFTIQHGSCGTAREGQLAKFIPGLLGLVLDVITFLYVADMNCIQHDGFL